MNTLSYKGYIGTVQVSFEDSCLHGKIEFINDVVTFEGNTPNEIKKSFETSVDEYLEVCNKVGKEPEKPFKGSFNVRTGPELHKKAALIAKTKGVTLNEFVCESVKKALQSEDAPEIHIHHHNHITQTDTFTDTFETSGFFKTRKDYTGWEQIPQN